jgi:Tfp pilus assembly protein PilO
MKRLSPDKRNKLILVIVATLALIGAVYFFLIDPQNHQNHLLATKTNADLTRLQEMKKALKQSDATAGTVEETAARLSHAEEDMASGDVFAWTYDTIRKFKANRRIEITTIGQPVQSDVGILANFPYKQIKFEIIGNGFYHDIGKFAADLENKFPHMRIINLSIDTATGSESVNEKLSFRMEIAVPVNPNT